MEATLRRVTTSFLVCIQLAVVCKIDRLNFMSVNAEEMSETQQRSFSAGDIVVFDNIFSGQDLLELQNLLEHEETAWQFFSKDVCSQFTGSSEGGIHDVQSYEPYQWKAKLDPAVFAKSSVWREISKVALSQSSLSADSILPYQLSGLVVVGGDFVQPMKCNDSFGSDYAAIVFLTKKWKRNAYGELLVYSLNEEVLKAIHPRYGRMVVFPCELKHVLRPPSVGNKLHLRAIAVYFSSLEKVFPKENVKNEQVNTLEPRKSVFPYISLEKLLSKEERPELQDVSKYVTRKMLTQKGKPIMVFDGAINQKDLQVLTQAVNHGSYNYAPPGQDSADNVQWILQFEVDDLVKTRLWKDIKQIAAYVSGESDCYPYDVGCNNIRNFDNTKIHNDLTYGSRMSDNSEENEYTFLMYLNHNWTEDFHGETVFFDDEDSANPEMIFAVKPKHGRVCVFHGGIPHSGRPPSLEFRGIVP